MNTTLILLVIIVFGIYRGVPFWYLMAMIATAALVLNYEESVHHPDKTRQAPRMLIV